MRKASKTDYGYNSAFPCNLRKIMDDNHTTQAVLAKECGVERQSVAQWRDGNTRPDILSLQKIAEFYNVSTDWLLGVPGAEKTTDKATKELCATLGLPDDVIDFLSNDENQWGRNVVAFLIDQHFSTLDEPKTHEDVEAYFDRPVHECISLLSLLSSYLETVSMEKDIRITLDNNGMLKICISNIEVNNLYSIPIFANEIAKPNNSGAEISFLECATSEIISEISNILRSMSAERATQIEWKGYFNDENSRETKKS